MGRSPHIVVSGETLRHRYETPGHRVHQRGGSELVAAVAAEETHYAAPCGFANRDLREQLAVLTGQMPTTIIQGRMTYDRRRLRLHGMIERIPKTHRYRVTPFGLRAALFFTRVHARLWRPAVTRIMSNSPPDDTGLAHPFARLEAEIDKCIQHAKLVA